MANTSSMPETTDVPDDLSLRQSVEIQGDILAGFNKDHRMYLMLQFTDPQLGRAWLGEMVPRLAKTKDVAAFNKRFSDARRAKGGDDPDNLKARWLGFSLTYAGLIFLGPALQADLDDAQFGFAAFREGPATRAAQLNDTGLSDPQTWVFGGLNDGGAEESIHALLVVAADDPDDLLTELEKLRALATRCEVVTIYEQRGETLPGTRAGHEHFGFKDGISQPGVHGFDHRDPRTSADDPQVLNHLGSDILAAGDFVLGYDRQSLPHPDTTPPQGTEPHPHPAWMKDGAFQVFRRLKQDVPGFWAKVTTLAHSPTFADPPTEDGLAAKLVGRWRSGTPIDTAPLADHRYLRDPDEDNHFEFNDLDQNGDPILGPDGKPRKDPDGLRCPRFAHIRKMYPRDNDSFVDERRRIIRRGIPFGLPFDPADGRGHGVDADRGLLFVAYMASIEEQFEFLQQSWANNPQFPDANAGPDPVIGTAPAPCVFKRDGQEPQELTIQRFVHTTGALYGFAPAISTLQQIADGTYAGSSSSSSNGQANS